MLMALTLQETRCVNGVNFARDPMHCVQDYTNKPENEFIPYICILL